MKRSASSVVEVATVIVRLAPLESIATVTEAISAFGAAQLQLVIARLARTKFTRNKLVHP